MRHDWRLLGGSADWELWRCARCGRRGFPLPLIGVLWPWPARRVPR